MGGKYVGPPPGVTNPQLSPDQRRSMPTRLMSTPALREHMAVEHGVYSNEMAPRESHEYRHSTAHIGGWSSHNHGGEEPGFGYRALDERTPARPPMTQRRARRLLNIPPPEPGMR